MGRLFWKFFFFIWLAQLTTFLGVSSLVWVKILTQEERALEISLSPPASFAVNAAAATLQFGGPAALENLLESRDPRRMHSVYAVDESGRDLLGREVAPALLEQARALAGMREPPGDAEAPRGVRQVRASDGHSYTLYLPASAPRGEARPGMEGGGGPSAGPPPPGMEPRPGMHQGSYLRRMIPPYEPLLGGLLVSLVFAALLAHYITRPIRHLRGAFEAAASGNLKARVGPVMGGRRDELADLGRDFDHMAGRLELLIEGQRRLLHDVSHEMRSPLARMQAAIGLAHQPEKDGSPARPEKLAAAIVRVEREAARMDQLVGELLTLARLESGVSEGHAEPVNVLELVADIVEDARFEAEAAGRHVDFDGAAEALVLGQAELLHRAFENVIRNAVKHTAEHTSVSVAAGAGATPGEWCLTVCDAGPGVAENELASIFEPFVRGGNAYSTDGHGLGLAIARRVIETHRGRITARNRPEGGLCVDIVLPVARPAGAAY